MKQDAEFREWARNDVARRGGCFHTHRRLIRHPTLTEQSLDICIGCGWTAERPNWSQGSLFCSTCKRMSFYCIDCGYRCNECDPFSWREYECNFETHVARCTGCGLTLGLAPCPKGSDCPFVRHYRNTGVWRDRLR